MVQASPIEYTIYTFDRPIANQRGGHTWKKHVTIPDMHMALLEAQTLYQTRKFQKIEIKKKFFDEKKNRAVDMTLKTYESTPRRSYRPYILGFLAVLCMLGLVGCLFSFLLTLLP